MAQANIGALNRRTSLKPRMFMRKYIWFYILLIPAIVYFVIFKYCLLYTSDAADE